MKTSFKILIALAIISGAFAVYFFTMANTNVAKDIVKPVEKAQKRPEGDGGVLNRGEKAWVSQYDPNGQLSYRFNAFNYTPQNDGTILVSKPEAEMFLKGRTPRT